LDTIPVIAEIGGGIGTQLPAIRERENKAMKRNRLTSPGAANWEWWWLDE
jgi:hypothetical protein